MSTASARRRPVTPTESAHDGAPAHGLTAPAGTVPAGTVPAGTVPEGTVPAGTGQPPAAPAGAGELARDRRGGWLASYGPLLIPAVVMAVYGIWGLARDSAMGNDEVATKWAALLSLRHLAHLLRNIDAVHGLYYLLMHGWVVFGASPAVLRIPSVLAMIGAAFVIALLARRLTGSAWAGVFAGLAMALTPAVSFYAQTARSYALVYLCVAGATLVLVKALAAEVAGDSFAARRWWTGYGVLVLVGAYLNEMSLLILAAHGVTVLLSRYGRRIFTHWLATSAISAVLVIPLLVVSSRQAGAVSWIPRPGLAALKALGRNDFGATIPAALLVVLCAVVALLPRRGQPASATSAGQEQPDGRWWRTGGVTLPSVALPLLVLPAALLIIESLVAHPLYVDRYVLYCEAGAALLAGGGAYRIGQWLSQVRSARLNGGGTASRALIALPGVIVCALILVLQLVPQGQARLPGSREYNFGGPSQYVAANSRPGDGVLFFGTLFRKARLGYPRDFRNVTDFGMAVTPIRAGNFRGIDKPASQVDSLMTDYQRIWVLGARPSPGLTGTLGQESSELARDFTQVAHKHYKGVMVTLWQRR